MASILLPVSRGSLLQRAYASLAEVDPTLPSPDFVSPSWKSVQTTRLSNGVTVVSEDSMSPMSSVSVVVGAGSSRETVGGTSAVMRALAFKATTTTSAFRKVRETELRGTTLACTGDRETITYSAKFQRDNAASAVELLSDSALNQAFQSWDVMDAKSFLATVGEDVGVTDILVDAVHTGAFRSGLGKSVYCDSFRLPSITADGLAEFAASNITAEHITVVGADIGHADLVALATEAFGEVATADAAAAGSSYIGGTETRVASSLGSTQYALGFEGAARGSADVASAVVLEKVLFGNGVAIPYGAGNATIKVVEAVGAGAKIDSFNLNYNGTGLIGAVLSVSGNARAAVSGFAGAVKKVLGGSISDADVARAKAQASATVLEMSSAERAAFYASASIDGGTPLSPEAFAEAIEAQTTASVKAFAAKVGASKPVAVVTGDIDDVPFYDDLKL